MVFIGDIEKSVNQCYIINQCHLGFRLIYPVDGPLDYSSGIKARAV